MTGNSGKCQEGRRWEKKQKLGKNERLSVSEIENYGETNEN